MHWVEPARDDRERAVERRRETAPPRTPQILALQRTAGNRAVAAMLSRTLSVDNINYDESSGGHTPEPIPIQAFRDGLRDSTFLSKLTQTEKDRLRFADTDVHAADLPALAREVVLHVAGPVPGRQTQLLPYVGEVEAALVKATPVKVRDEDDIAVFNRIKLQATMSRSKGTPNTITLANLGKVLPRAGAGAASLNLRVKANNAAAANLGSYMTDPDFGPSALVTYDLPVRSPHTNGAGWLPAAQTAARLDAAAANWATNVVANQHDAIGNSLSATFGAPPNGVTARAIEEDITLVAGARRQYYHQVWAALNARQRAEHAWTQYTTSFVAQCAFVEFTAEKGLGVNRFVWDMIADRYYVSLHYNWVEGYNPFFEVTGLQSSY